MSENSSFNLFIFTFFPCLCPKWLIVANDCLVNMQFADSTFFFLKDLQDEERLILAHLNDLVANDSDKFGYGAISHDW